MINTKDYEVLECTPNCLIIKYFSNYKTSIRINGNDTEIIKYDGSQIISKKTLHKVLNIKQIENILKRETLYFKKYDFLKVCNSVINNFKK